MLAHKGETELVLLDPEDGSYYTLDEVGARVWELADGTRTAEQIAAALAEEFDAPLETIQADLLELLGELTESGLMTDAGA
jgi:pyrroloquinoline quinone biosynthesis protein D